MTEHAYDPPFGQPAAAPSTNGHAPVIEPPAPPRMSIVPGDGGLGVMFAALAKAQLNFKPVKADAHVQVDTREKGSYKFSYAPLENVLAACVPALNAEGFFFSQPLYSAADGEGYVLRTCLMHASGGMIEVQTYIPKPAGRIQDLGSAITYQRRYVAQALFGVNSEDDDDGAQASGDKRTVQQRAPQPSAAPATRSAQNGAPATGPKGGTGAPATATGAASPATSTTTAPAGTKPESIPSPSETSTAGTSTPKADPAPANETTVERDLTPEQHKEIGALFKQLVPRVSAPMASKIVLEVTGKAPDQLKYEDGETLKKNLQDRIAKQGAAS